MSPSHRFRNVAIVHDWLVGGGAERVVLELHRMFPDAPIYTSYCTDEWRQKLDNKVVTGWLQRWPFNKLRKFLPVLRFWWFEHLDLSGYDLVISSSGNGEAKSVKVPHGTVHVCYCHSPTHFYWRHFEQYYINPGMGRLDPVARIGLRVLLNPLRKHDLVASTRPHYMIANSSHIQVDIERYYGRSSTVIFPPIDVGRFATYASKTVRRGFITVGRQQPQKRTDIIIEACTRLNLPLTVIGSGSEHERLVAMAGPTVRFITGADATDEVVRQELSDAQAFIFAAFDDFGIAPIEAMAAGTPVIAYQAGGALDYVQPGKTGEFFLGQTTESLAEALQEFDPSIYNPTTIKQAAERFSADNFRAHMTDFLNRL